MGPPAVVGDRVASFLYLLARHHMAFGEVERLVGLAIVHSASPEIKTGSPANASWAYALAQRLRA